MKKIYYLCKNFYEFCTNDDVFAKVHHRTYKIKRFSLFFLVIEFGDFKSRKIKLECLRRGVDFLLILLLAVTPNTLYGRDTTKVSRRFCFVGFTSSEK